MSYNNSTALIFEVSQGCQMNCTGCNVDKRLDGLPPKEEMDKLLGMFRGLKENNVPFMEIELGPTDLLRARNRHEIFTNPDVQELVRMFKLTTLTGSFIYPDEKDYEAFAKQAHALSPDNWVGIAMPIEMKQVFNDKYIQRIQRNVDIFRNHLPNYLNETILNVIFDERFLSNVGSKYSYEDLFSRVNDLKLTNNTKVDFVFHHGRSKIDSAFVASDFLRSIRELNRHYLRDLRTRSQKAEVRHMPFQLSCDGRGGEILYHRGELYFRPVINERITILSEKMKFTGEWSAENYFANLFQRYHDNVSKSLEYEDCVSCEHAAMCADRYIHDLMDVCNTRECITMLKSHGGFVHEPTKKDLEKLTLN